MAASAVAGSALSQQEHREGTGGSSLAAAAQGGQAAQPEHPLTATLTRQTGDSL